MNPIKFPPFITWCITSHCNLNCIHCFHDPYQVLGINREKVLDFANLLVRKKVISLVLTGGEPLLSPILEDILNICGHKMKIGIATNGILLTEKRLESLVEMGVSCFQISLEGTNSLVNDFIRGDGVYKKILSNISLINKEEIDLTVAMTVNSFNYNDIYDNAISFALKNKIKKIRLENYIPINKTIEIDSVSTNKIIKLYNHLISENIKHGNTIKIQTPFFDSKYLCGAGIYNCVVNADFSLSPCDILCDKLRTKPIDNVNDFDTMWLEDNVFLEWRTKLYKYSNSKSKEQIPCYALHKCKSNNYI